MKKIILILLLVSLSIVAFASLKKPPQFQTGDIIFHTSKTRLSAVTASVTMSKLTHVGMIIVKDNKNYVIEAVGPVRIVPLERFVNSGLMSRYSVRRLKKPLTKTQKRKVTRAAKKFLGRRYDHKFSWTDRKFYCSELVYKAYRRAVGIKIGKLQKKGDIYSENNPLLKSYVKRVYKGKLPLKETILTPVSMYDSGLLETIYSNYPLP